MRWPVLLEGNYSTTSIGIVRRGLAADPEVVYSGTGSSAIGPLVRGPIRDTHAALSGFRMASSTAEASYPQCAMQFAHLGFFELPYLSHGVSSMSALKDGA